MKFKQLACILSFNYFLNKNFFLTLKTCVGCCCATFRAVALQRKLAIGWDQSVKFINMESHRQGQAKTGLVGFATCMSGLGKMSLSHEIACLFNINVTLCK